MSLTADFLASCWAPLENDAAHLASRNAVATTDVLTVVQNRDVLQNRSHVYSNQVSKEGKATTQKSSGRCWMFAMCNVMRVELMKKYKLPTDFEPSQGFLFFYDKLERGNYFLESVIKRAWTLVRLEPSQPDPGDEGQWDMLVNIVQKYGVCPKSAFPRPNAALHLAA